MPLRRGTAQKILSEPEFKLVNESFTPAVNALGEKALGQRIERARKLRDKYQAMVERQQAKIDAGTSKGGKREAQAAAKALLKDTVYKHRMLSETLTRFEKTSNGSTKSSTKTNVAAVNKTSTKKAVKSPAGKAAKSARSGSGTAPMKPVTKRSASAAKKVTTKKPATKKVAKVKAVPKKASPARATKASKAQQASATKS